MEKEYILDKLQLSQQVIIYKNQLVVQTPNYEEVLAYFQAQNMNPRDIDTLIIDLYPPQSQEATFEIFIKLVDRVFSELIEIEKFIDFNWKKPVSSVVLSLIQNIMHPRKSWLKHIAIFQCNLETNYNGKIWGSFYTVIGYLRQVKTFCLALGSILKIQKLTELGHLQQRYELMKHITPMNDTHGEGLKYIKRWAKWACKSKIEIENLDLDFFALNLNHKDQVKNVVSILRYMSELGTIRSFSLVLQSLRSEFVQDVQKAIQNFVASQKNLLSISIFLIKIELSHQTLLYEKLVSESLVQHCPNLQTLRKNYSITHQQVQNLTTEDLEIFRDAFRVVPRHKNLTTLSVTLGNLLSNDSSLRVLGEAMIEALDGLQKLENFICNIGCDVFEGNLDWLDPLQKMGEALLKKPNLQTLVLFLNNWKKVDIEGQVILYQFVRKLLEKQKIRTLGVNLANFQPVKKTISSNDFQFKLIYELFLNYFDKSIKNLGFNFQNWDLDSTVQHKISLLQYSMRAYKQIKRQSINQLKVLRAELNKKSPHFRKEILWDVHEFCFSGGFFEDHRRRTKLLPFIPVLEI